MNYSVYSDREEAGQRLADRLRSFDDDDAVVVGLARVGMPIAREVAAALDAPLDVVVVRRIRIPWFPELAVGAIASGGSLVLDDERVAAEQLTQGEIESLIHRELDSLLDRERVYREVRPRVNIAGRTAILVDEGICTGWRMRAAIRAVRDAEPERLIVAVPVASERACRQVRRLAEEFICPVSVEQFTSPSQFYGYSPPTSDAEVVEILRSVNQTVVPGYDAPEEELEPMLAQINITPVGAGEHLAESVSKVIEFIAESGLDYQVTAMGTLVEGPPDRLWPLIRRCHDLARQDHARVVTEIRIDDRNLSERELHRDVRRVEEILGRPLNRTA